MSESIKKIKVEKDINIGVYFTNVYADLSLVRQSFQSNGNSGVVRGPWNELFKVEEESYGLIGNDNEMHNITIDTVNIISFISCCCG